MQGRGDRERRWRRAVGECTGPGFTGQDHSLPQVVPGEQPEMTGYRTVEVPDRIDVSRSWVVNLSWQRYSARYLDLVKDLLFGQSHGNDYRKLRFIDVRRAKGAGNEVTRVNGGAGRNRTNERGFNRLSLLLSFARVDQPTQVPDS